MAGLAIIGSGITGALTAYMLKQALPHVKVTILDKARGVGGRMCTSRNPLNDNCTADVGAQYFSFTCSTSETAKQFYEELTAANLLQPMNVVVEGMRPNEQKMKHYVCAKGSGSIVKYFINKAGCQTYFGERVIEIFPSSSKSNWTVKTENSTRDGFNGVIFTIPVPQVLEVKGISTMLSDEQKGDLQKVVYNSRLALGLFYDENSAFVNSIPWAIKYVADNPAIRYMSIDNKKRGTPFELTSVVIHTTKEFGKTHIDGDISEVQELILDNVRNLIPNLSQPSQIKFHKWRYSQVEEPYPGKPGCIIIKSIPLLICGGDGFSSSTLDGCIYSAEKITSAVVRRTTFP